MLLRLLRWGYRMYQEGLNPPSEQILQAPYSTETNNSLKGRKINMDSSDIARVVSDLNELLSDSERVQEEASTKVDELTEIKDGLEEANSDLGEAVSALEGLDYVVEKVERLLNDADNQGIN